MRPVSKAKFLGVEVTSNLNFRDHIQTLAQRAEKRLNILRILAWGGTEPKILLRLYKVYIRSIFEYGSVSFLHCPDSLFDVMQRVQNKAIRVCLRLPRYVSLRILHESSCLPTIKERLLQLGGRAIVKMRAGNPLVCALIKEKDADNLQTVLTQSQNKIHRSHRNSLDILLPVQRPISSSTQT